MRVQGSPKTFINGGISHKRVTSSQQIIVTEEQKVDEYPLIQFLAKLKEMKEKVVFLNTETLFDEAMALCNQMRELKATFMREHSEFQVEAQNAWEELIDNDPERIFHCVERDYKEMMEIVKRLDDYEGFQLVKDITKRGIKMYMIKEEGQKLVTIKFTAERVKIPIFNLLTLIYETEHYNQWFPFCKSSFDVTYFSH